MKKAKWERDPDAEGERYASWSLMPAGTSQSDAVYVDPIAHIAPVWGGSARMSGAPTGWSTTVRGKWLGTYPGVVVAKKAVALAMSTPSDEAGL